MNFRPSARPDLTKLAVPNGSNEPRCTKRRYVDAFWRLARLALSLAFPVALVAGSPPIIVRSPPLQVSPATTERLVKLGAFRSGPILFKVGCKVVRGGIVKVSVEQSSGYSFLDREGADWVTKHWRFGVAATGTYHVPLVVGARTGRVTSQAIASAPHPVHLVPKLTWNALVQSHNGVAFNMRLLVRIEVRDGLVLSARVTRTSGRNQGCDCPSKRP